MGAPENSADLGGLKIPSPDGQNASSETTGGNVSASAETIRQRKTRSDAGKPRGPRGAQPESSVQAVPLSQLQFAKLYSPEIWERTLCAPADAMAAISGKPYWEVSQKEREAVGATGSIAAQCFAVSDPRWLALAVCGITLLDIYGVRMAMWLADRKREREEEAKKKREQQQR